MLRVAVIDRLRKEGHARLVPEPMPEKERRVSTHAEYRTGGKLNGVERSCKLARIDPQVDLERRIGAFERHVIAASRERIFAIDLDFKRGLAELTNSSRELLIAGQVRESFRLHIISSGTRASCRSNDTGRWTLATRSKAVNVS